MVKVVEYDDVQIKHAYVAYFLLRGDDLYFFYDMELT